MAKNKKLTTEDQMFALLIASNGMFEILEKVTNGLRASQESLEMLGCKHNNEMDDLIHTAEVAINVFNQMTK